MSATHAHRAHSRSDGGPHHVGLFGGSFDPVHLGHLAVAGAAQRRFHLDAVHFIPCGRPSHKPKYGLAAFPHRFAMVALACAEHPHFLPSLAEGGPDLSGHQVSYSIDTVRHFRRALHHPDDRLYFVLGADSFLKISTWKEYETLLGLCDFIVASRPGFRSDVLRLVIPPELLGRTASPDPHRIALRRTAVHLLDNVSCDVSATEVRGRLQQGQSIHGLVPARVEEYIGKQALYR